MTSVFVPGIKKKMKLRTKADHEAILTELTDADAVVFSMPLYANGILTYEIESFTD
jgi:FMN-dependent NADH-azoreductase